ncbi:MAG: hypothetical protein ACREM3_07320 [Candidatus Rokuibacteriota bacterium]
MVTRDEVARQPLEQRTARLTLTADDLAAAIRGQPEAVLGRRPEATSWAATEKCSCSAWRCSPPWTSR